MSGGKVAVTSKNGWRSVRVVVAVKPAGEVERNARASISRGMARSADAGTAA